MSGVPLSTNNVVGTANTLLEARELARKNQGNEKIVKTGDSYSVVKIDDNESNNVKQRPKADYDPSIVEFSVQKTDGTSQEVTNSNTSFMNKAKIAYTDSEEVIIGAKAKANQALDKGLAAGKEVLDKGIELGKETLDRGIELGKEGLEVGRRIILGETTPRPTDGPIIEGRPSPSIINDLKSGKMKLPVYVKITNKDNKEVSYFQLNQKTIDSLKEVEFPKSAQGQYGFSDTQRTNDGTVTKGYGCTDTSLHPYLVAGKTEKAEKAAEAVLVYQAITHAQERFNQIPKIFLDHLDDGQKTALISSGFNMSAGMFAGGTSKNAEADNPNGFLPIRKMNEAWDEITKGDGDLSYQDVKDAINLSFGSFVSGFRDGQSGLQARRTFDFIIGMGGNPGVSSPYGEQKKLSESLMNMYNSEMDPSRKASMRAVIDVLKTFPTWSPHLK
jgi:hypothetical protein